MLIRRNCQLFFKDRANVFFSLLAVFIIIGLYVLFLGDLMEGQLQAVLGFESDKISVTMASMTLAGMVAVTTVTSCMGALSISIQDKEGPAKDFYTSPVSRAKITLGYIIGSGVVGLVMTVFAMLLCFAYIIANGGTVPGGEEILRLAVTTVLSILCGNSMVFLITTLIKSANAFSAASSVIGTLIGFVMGIYIPIGSFPEAVQWVVKLFPMSHAASMYRQIFADGELAALFANAPDGVLDGFRELYGMTFAYGGVKSGFWFSAAVLAVSSVVFFGLSVAVGARRSRVE